MFLFFISEISPPAGLSPAFKWNTKNTEAPPAASQTEDTEFRVSSRLAQNPKHIE
ncbi:hypothetical protein ABI_29420 [Asticcacaulis biprosthecium C19]|uniref:Uncharacterized protein n=1 Tax=Asticcacaulis biprosthecium C19 TaxID=715226 RepID=F4QMT4_9CAUL|nr:hypothetical protein ABI_29420 [Asticcacaulis biprosthecium C19]